MKTETQNKSTVCDKCGKGTTNYIDTIYWDRARMEIYECDYCKNEKGEQYRFMRRARN